MIRAAHRIGVPLRRTADVAAPTVVGRRLSAQRRSSRPKSRRDGWPGLCRLFAAGLAAVMPRTVNRRMAAMINRGRTRLIWGFRLGGLGRAAASPRATRLRRPESGG